MHGYPAILDCKQSIKKRAEGSDAEEKTPIDYADVFANLSFWYHLPYSEIRSMPHSAIMLYMERLPKFKAELRMILGEAASVPYMDEEHHRDWLISIEDVLGSKRQNQLTPPAMMKMIGIGVEVMPKEVRNNDG